MTAPPAAITIICQSLSVDESEEVTPPPPPPPAGHAGMQVGTEILKWEPMAIGQREGLQPMRAIAALTYAAKADPVSPLALATTAAALAAAKTAE